MTTEKNSTSFEHYTTLLAILLSGKTLNVVSASKALSSKASSSATRYKRTCERFLSTMHDKGVIYVSGWSIYKAIFPIAEFSLQRTPFETEDMPCPYSPKVEPTDFVLRSRNDMLVLNGQPISIRGLAEKTGASYTTVWGAYRKGKTAEQILTSIGKHRKKKEEQAKAEALKKLAPERKPVSTVFALAA